MSGKDDPFAGGAEACIFSLDGRRFAVPLALVSEVARMPAVTPLEGAPSVVEGLVDARGEVAPVLDVRARFGLPVRPPRLSDHLLLVRAGDRLVGFRVDQVLGIERLEAADISPLQSLVPGAPHLVGVARVDGELVLIHDPGAFLAAEESDALDRALGVPADG